MGFPDGPLVKTLPASVEGPIPGSGRSPLEKEMATHPSILAWGIPGTEKPGGLQSMGSQELDMTEQFCTVEKAIW